MKELSVRLALGCLAAGLISNLNASILVSDDFTYANVTYTAPSQTTTLTGGTGFGTNAWIIPNNTPWSTRPQNTAGIVSGTYVSHMPFDVTTHDVVIEFNRTLDVDGITAGNQGVSLATGAFYVGVDLNLTIANGNLGGHDVLRLGGGDLLDWTSPRSGQFWHNV